MTIFKVTAWGGAIDIMVDPCFITNHGIISYVGITLNVKVLRTSAEMGGEKDSRDIIVFSFGLEIMR